MFELIFIIIVIAVIVSKVKAQNQGANRNNTTYINGKPVKNNRQQVYGAGQMNRQPQNYSAGQSSRQAQPYRGAQSNRQAQPYRPQPSGRPVQNPWSQTNRGTAQSRPQKNQDILSRAKQNVQENNEGAKKALYAEVDRAIDVNKKRKAMTKESVERVVENYEANGGNDPFIVCYDEYTVSGIVGLVASELVNRYHRPALVFAPSGKDDGVIKGSGRSVEGVGIKGLLDQVQQYLTTYGGHPMACGASLLIDNLDAFGDAVNAITPVLDTSDAIMYDLECTYTEAATKLAEQEQFEPYGAGNPQPVYRINGVELCEPEYMGGNSQHIKFQTKDADILWFDGRKAYEDLGSPKMVDMLVTMSYHEFK